MTIVDSKAEKKKTVHINILLEVHSMEIMAHKHLERTLRFTLESAVLYVGWNNTKNFMLLSLQFAFHVLKRAFIALRIFKSVGEWNN
jgi:hypothetical protein